MAVVDRYGQQATVLLWVQVALFFGIVTYCLTPPSFGIGGALVYALLMAPPYAGLVLVSLRRAWTGTWPLLAVATATGWIAQGQVRLIAEMKVGIDSPYAAYGLSLYAFWVLLLMPLLIFFGLWVFLPKDPG